MKSYLLSLTPALVIAFAACSSEPTAVEPQSLKITPHTTDAQVGGEAVSFTATLAGVTGDVVWALVPEVGTLSNLTGSETSYTPPASATTPAMVMLTASAGDLSTFALISLTSVSDTHRVLRVNPETGVDTNDGSSNAPLKTIRRALTLADAGTALHLAGGVYSEASGETFLEVTDGESGYLVPASVKITADPNDDAKPVVIRNDAAVRDAFRFAGDGRLTGVRLEGFNRGLFATTGIQLLNDVTMLSLSESGVALEGSASLSCTDCNISMAGGIAFNLKDTARLRVDGASSINATSPANEPTLVAVYLQEGSQAEAVLDLVGGTSRGTHAVAGGKLTLRNVDVHLRRNHRDGIFVGPEGHLALFDGRVAGGYFASGDSMEALNSSGTLTINGTIFEDNPGGSLSLDGGVVDIRNAVFQNIGVPDAVFGGNGLNAIVVDGATALKMRGTEIRNVKEAGNYNPPTPGTHGTGLYITDASGGIDLGTAAEPGRNHFQDCGMTCLEVGQSAGTRTVQAVGNTWEPGEQGADADGRYGPRLVDEGSFGRNFRVNNTSSIQF